tara:strand:- start:36884 stop:36988 length:105 start_codon:yes stop_codon:yes gene_type:complete
MVVCGVAHGSALTLAHARNVPFGKAGDTGYAEKL